MTAAAIVKWWSETAHHAVRASNNNPASATSRGATCSGAVASMSGSDADRVEHPLKLDD
jgi:hypothetical protein